MNSLHVRAGNKKAACTLSVDDGIPQPTPVMAKVFNDNDVRGYLVPGGETLD